MPRRLLPVSMTLCFALLPAWSQAAEPCEHLVAIGVGARVPYQWLDGAEPQGASVTLLNRVAAGLGVTLDVLTAENPEQAEREVSSGRVDLLIDAELRPQLQAGLDFLEPPLHEAPVVVWVAKDRVFPFQDWDDLGGRRGVRIDNTEWETESDQRADAQLQLRPHGDFVQALQSLLAGQIDYVLHDHVAGQAAVLRHGWADEVVVLMPALYSQPRYLALSHNSACNTAGLRDGLTRALGGLQGEQSGASIVRQHLQQWAERRRSD